MLLFKKLSLVAVAVVASLPMLALPTLRITDCGTDGCGTGVDSLLATVSDDGAGDLLNPDLGTVLYNNSSLGNWGISLTSAYTYPAVIGGTSSSPIMSLTGTVSRKTGTTPSYLMIEFSEISYDATSFAGANTTTANTVAGQSVVGDATFGVSSDPGNVLFAGGNNYLGLATQAFSPTAASRTGVVTNLSPASSLTLTAIMRIGTNNAGVTFDSKLSSVPEPGFYGALALGLSGLFAVVARRRKSANA